MPKTRNDVRFNAPAKIQAGAENDDADYEIARVRIVAYTGCVMDLRPQGETIIDIQGMEFASPIRLITDHENAVDSALGIGTATIEGRNVIVTGQIIGVSTKAKEVIGSARNGFPWAASVGGTIHESYDLHPGESAVVNGQTVTADRNQILIVTRMTVREVSILPLGADEHTSMELLARMKASEPMPPQTEQMPGFEDWVMNLGFKIEDLDDNQRNQLQNLYDSQKAELGAGDDNGGDDGDDDEESDEKGAGKAVVSGRATIASERQRLAGIVRACAGKNPKLQARAIERGWTVQQTELAVLRASRPRGIPIGLVSREANDAMQHKTIEAAMLLSGGLSERAIGAEYGQNVMNEAISRQYRGFGIHSLVQATLAAHGQHVPPRIGQEEIRAALQIGSTPAGLSLQAAGDGWSTVSLPSILANVLNKSMLLAYSAQDTAWQFVCQQTDIKDFKPASRLRLVGNGRFDKVGAQGEIKHVSLQDQQYSLQLETSGALISLSRQMMLNDDLGALLDVPQQLGRMAAIALETEVFSVLLGNANSFFSAGNGNLLTGSNSALSLDSLTTARQNFRLQKDPNGFPILLTPRTLLVPPELEVTGENIVRSTSVVAVAVTTAGTPTRLPTGNALQGLYQVVGSPFLSNQNITGQSSTAWYLLGDPAVVPPLLIGFLNGQRVPIVEGGQADFNVLGVQWRSYFDFGVGQGDYRAAVRSDGV